MSVFYDRVYELVARIPYGKVLGYGHIARILGNPRASRGVGWAMRVCPDALPWQRVVRSDGTIAGGNQTPIRRALLEQEGVPFLPDGRVDMEKALWQGPYMFDTMQEESL